MLKIFIDADGCPVKQEVYRVAKRYELQVILVANAWMRIPFEASIQLEIVENELDAADDWIVEHVVENDIVVTADIPLASRCLDKGAKVLGPRGRIFSESGIGNALATRDLQEQLRNLGLPTRGPAPFQKKHRSQFLHTLDEIIQKINRESDKN